MSMYPFSYSAVYYSGTDSETDTSKYACESGMSFCDSFAEAATIIAERYGDELVCIKDLTLYEEDSVILLPTETIHNYATDMFHDNAYFHCDEFGNPISEKKLFADLLNEDGTFKNSDNFEPIPLRERNKDGTFKKSAADLEPVPMKKKDSDLDLEAEYVIGKPTNYNAKIPIEG